MDDEWTATPITELVDVLGARTVALIGSADRTSTVRNWVEQGALPDETAWRLACASRVVRVLLQRVGRATIVAWFWSANHDLDDEMPVTVLSKAARVACENVVTAAGSFGEMF